MHRAYPVSKARQRRLFRKFSVFDKISVGLNCLSDLGVAEIGEIGQPSSLLKSGLEKIMI